MAPRAKKATLPEAVAAKYKLVTHFTVVRIGEPLNRSVNFNHVTLEEADKIAELGKQYLVPVKKSGSAT
jgi:hypothetical protein